MRSLLVALAVLSFSTTVVSTIEAQRARGRGPRTRREPAAEPASAPANPFDEPAGSAPPPEANAPAAAPTSTTSASSPGSVAPGSAAVTSTASPTTAAGSVSVGPVDPGPTPPDLAPVRTDLAQLMDDMVQTRQRMALLGQELFRTRIRIALQDRAGDALNLARCVVELDGAPVFRSDGEIAGGGDGRVVHEGSLAPGPHVLTIDLEQRAVQDAEVRYTQRESFRIHVHRERLTDVEIVLEDGSNMVEQFQRGGEGRYEVRTRVRVATRELPRGS